MVPIILMVLGGIFLAISFVGFIAFLINPFLNDLKVVFKRDDDPVYYQTKPGQELLRKSSRHVRDACLASFFVGIVLFGTGWYLRHASHGEDLVITEDIGGTHVGEDTVQELMERANEAVGVYVDDSGAEFDCFVMIIGDRIYYREILLGSTEDFEEFLPCLSRDRTVTVVDNYAVSATYHDVVDLLRNNGIRYRFSGD